MDDTHKLALIVIPATWIVAIISSLVIYFAFDSSVNMIYLKSYIIGVAVSLLNFGLTVKGARGFLKEVAKQEEGSPVRHTVIGYIIRFILAASIFVIVVINQNSESPSFHIVPTIIGYMTLKIVLMMVVLIKKGKVSE